MPGDDWQKFANLRLLYGYQFTLPGKKLLFMGNELGQWEEWNHEQSLDWHLLDYETHLGIRRWVADLNRLYREEPALHELDCDPSGFEWIQSDDAAASTLSFLRHSKDGRTVLVVGNFTPEVRHDMLLAVPTEGTWREILNSDSSEYGGSGVGNLGEVQASPIPLHGRPCSVRVTAPPLSLVMFRHISPGNPGES
jgi:1,4-alpha-glucan branching enzyme